MSLVLFLDFHGVTHPDPGWNAEPFCRLPLIEAVLRDFPCADIVISSSWRDHHSLEDIRGFFAADIVPRDADVTPSIKTPSADWLAGFVPTHEREWEIETWMKANRPWGTPWLAIDDRDWWFSPGSPNLLLTKAEEAFTEANAEELRLMLQDRLEPRP